MNKTYNALVLMSKTIDALKDAGFHNFAWDIARMYEFINDSYFEAIDKAREVKKEQEKGGKYEGL